MAYGFFSFATNVAAYGSLANYIKTGYGPQRFVIQHQALQFGAGIDIIGIASLFLMYIFFTERKTIKSLLMFSILLSVAYIVLLIGERRHIIYLSFIAFVIVNYRFFRIKLRWMVITMVLVYLFFFVYPHTRKLWAEIGFIRGLTETFKVAVEKPELMLPFAGGEFIPPSKIILEVLTDNSFQYSMEPAISSASSALSRASQNFCLIYCKRSVTDAGQDIIPVSMNEVSTLHSSRLLKDT